MGLFAQRKKFAKTLMKYYFGNIKVVVNHCLKAMITCIGSE